MTKTDASTTRDADIVAITHIAKLARLALSAKQLSDAAEDMRRVLVHVDTLRGLDVSAVPASAHGVSLQARQRDDVARPGLDLDKAMRNAPERLGDGFGVPKIIE